MSIDFQKIFSETDFPFFFSKKYFFKYSKNHFQSSRTWREAQTGSGMHCPGVSNKIMIMFVSPLETRVISHDFGIAMFVVCSPIIALAFSLGVYTPSTQLFCESVQRIFVSRYRDDQIVQKSEKSCANSPYSKLGRPGSLGGWQRRDITSLHNRIQSVMLGRLFRTHREEQTLAFFIFLNTI